MDKCIYCKGRGLRADNNDELCDVCLGTGFPPAVEETEVSEATEETTEEAPKKRSKKS